MEAFRPCAIVPTYDNPHTVERVVDALAGTLPVVLVDDGSGPEGAAACARAGAGEAVVLHRLERNRGKGAAVAAGFRLASERGFTHALQVDADAQHDLASVPEFLAAARERPDALVLGHPVYDRSAPASRRVARAITSFWVGLEVGSWSAIRDAMIGFRVYPLARIGALPECGAGMDFDIEIAVRLVRVGTPTVNLPVGVRYLSPEEGGVSHFRMFRDNLRFARMHSRLCMEGCLAWLGLSPRRP